MFRLTMLTVGLPLGLIFSLVGIYCLIAVESDWLGIIGGLAIMAGVALAVSSWNSLWSVKAVNRD